MLADYHPSVATVYSLLGEPSLAFLWTHGVTPSTSDLSLVSILVHPWTGDQRTGDANLARLAGKRRRLAYRPM